MKKEDVYVVGIAGGSASGKTTIIEKLKKQFKDEIVMISHDFYPKKSLNVEPTSLLPEYFLHHEELLYRHVFYLAQ